MIKKMSMEDFFQETFSEEFLREADAEYATAKIAGRAQMKPHDSGKFDCFTGGENDKQLDLLGGKR